MDDVLDRGDNGVGGLAGRASGIEAELRIFQAWTIRNGKLVRLESYLSRDEARSSRAAAVGAVPPSAWQSE